MDTVDCVVIGAGVVGLAVAAAVQAGGRETLVLERDEAYGRGVSARNSEVLHAGIYYPPGSLKARHCVRGRRLLLDWCEARGVPYRVLGKLIVASADSEVALLHDYHRRGMANGVGGLRMIDRAELRALEPEVDGVAALHSPQTGIIDAATLMSSLLAEFVAAGGQLICRSEVVSVRDDRGTQILTLADGYELEAGCIVNCAGLAAPRLARAIDPDLPGLPPEASSRGYCKGHYYELCGVAPFQHLVYPVAVPGGLGVHLTLDLAGRARFGPDVRWVDAEDYAFDDSRRAGFVAAITRYFPGIAERELQPGFTGIRPKLVDRGEVDADFVVARAPSGAGRVHLLGIESPGLTASLSLAEAVHGLLAD